MRVFISYSSKDRDAAEFIAKQLTSRGVSVFIDYESLQAGEDFTERLANEISGCQAVVFLLSEHSSASKWVRSEIQYAFKKDKTILPVRLDNANVPPSLFFLEGIHATDFGNWKNSAAAESTILLLTRALGLTETKGFPEAQHAMPSDAAEYARRMIEMLEPSAPQEEALTPSESSERPRRFVFSPFKRRLHSIDIMPTPFAWIEIPGANGKNRKGAPYSIAKYPVTNAQYAMFIEASGYETQKWWTAKGWQLCTLSAWREPKTWTDVELNNSDFPVVGVSWYEAIAYCLWLSNVTGEEIMLPTEKQWQYAAQGDDERDYPWGNHWDGSRCNNYVGLRRSGKTTPVKYYEGIGNSPFGVVDMAGNIFEWCLTDYENETNDIDEDAVERIERGGCWDSSGFEVFRTDYRIGLYPYIRSSTCGFRIVRN